MSLKLYLIKTVTVTTKSYKETYYCCSEEARISLYCFSVFSSLVLTDTADDDPVLRRSTEAFIIFSCTPGAVAWFVQPFLRPQLGSSYVRVPVVPHSFYCQISTLHGLPHHWFTTLWGKKNPWIRKPSLHLVNVLRTSVFLCFILLESFAV